MKLTFLKYLVMVSCLLLALFSILLTDCSGRTDLEAKTKPIDALNDSLLTLVQKQTFGYFWDGAEPISGMARERFHSDNIYPVHHKDIITTGGSGFGLMAILVAIERGFITRQEAVERLLQITDFLEKSDRFHGVWPHWLLSSGRVQPFSKNDDGGDIVETSFLAQGMLCVRQYFKYGNDEERRLSERIDKLWKGIEWDWYTQGQDVLYWHWSPKFAWEKDFAIRGYNETLITYVLAVSSPTHSVSTDVYHKGWAEDGAIKATTVKYDISLDLRHQGAPQYGGPLFWAHYSFMGLDPRGLQDQYADYWQHNVNQILIDRAYCIENPKGYEGYSEKCWGLTSSYSINGYSSHKPERDFGVIAPTAALGSFPYTPEYSMEALKHFYFDMGDKLWGEYGFYDAFSVTENWYPKRYLAIDQGPIIVMIENYRSGLLWKLFMSSPEVQMGLDKLGFIHN